MDLESAINVYTYNKKKLCNSSFLCLAFGNSVQSTSEFMELWNYGVFRQN